MNVSAYITKKHIPTYELGKSEINPVFFEKRVYQGSSGKVYPVPFIDKVYDHKVEKLYKVVELENEYVRLVLLPEIGGRIFEAQDKANNNYDFFYKQEVIKPALVGLAGPWISGGVEFNWPQHHRPGTYLPTDVYIEEEADGAKTVWMSEYDPMYRLKGMHGIRLRPGSALIELRGRLFNRTAITQTFLWWANVAVRVHEDYQSFFPPDVNYVADHAVRAMSSFPLAENYYYGIPYHERAGKNDLRKYENINVPTSYMVCDTKYNFFGGYDFKAKGGFVHVANRHIAPGKKQWTWGSAEFGKAWDRELTDVGGPYFELMAGIYTDNQPDFSYLLPFETKTFSQYWWSYKKLGPVQNANETLAVKLVPAADNTVDLGVASNKELKDLQIEIQLGNNKKTFTGINSRPEEPWTYSSKLLSGEEKRLSIAVFNREGKKLLAYAHQEPVETRSRKVAFEPKQAKEVESAIELNLIAEHLELYRHPTRYPEPYWEEGLQRDPLNYQAHLGLGKAALKQVVLDQARDHLQNAVDILTTYHPNPSTGEAHYYLGITQFYLKDYAKAYKALYKATWNYEWRSAAYFMLAKIDVIRQDFASALKHLEDSLDTNRQNNSAQILKAIILIEKNTKTEGIAILEGLIRKDPLDQWANYELGLARGKLDDFLQSSRNDAQTVIDVALEYIEFGFYERALHLIQLHHQSHKEDCPVPNPMSVSFMTHIILVWLHHLMGYDEKSEKILERIPANAFDYFFPSRLQEVLMLEWLIRFRPDFTLAAYGLGNFYFNVKRHQDAIDIWEHAASYRCEYATLYRNLGIAYWNAQNDGDIARQQFEQAIRLAPEDARIQFEYDQLRKKLNDDPGSRLESVQALGELVVDRDDFSVELAALYNRNGQYEQALQLILSRKFHPWEGGEGQVLKQYSYACLKLGQQALEENKPDLALAYFSKSLNTPDSLGEKYHPLQAVAHINYWKGKAYRALHREEDALLHFTRSAEEQGDFIDMAVSDFSELTYYKALSLKELGKEEEALLWLENMKEYAQKKLKTKAKIDYFATSLPLLLVFEDDIQKKNLTEAYYLLGLAELGLGNYPKSEKYFKRVLQLNVMYIGAAEYLKLVKRYKTETSK